MRFYCEKIDTESFLDPVESSHLCRVLRATKGTPVELFDGQGTLAEGIVEWADKKRTAVRVQKTSGTPSRMTGRMILAVSFAKGKRFDWLVEKCTELGADHIAAVQFERTVKLGKNTALERYRKITIAAAKQSKRLFLPKITGPAIFPATLNALIDLYPQAVLLYGEPKGVPLADVDALREGQDCIVVIGPEGGLCENELAFLSAKNSSGVTLNRNILRIETAAVAFCATLALTRL
ncbi:MAG: RsmE family RNA methyltransferase [Planctomycetota bacterium]|jgi:16S rRNA (uracil1498-N3)-methyltransferase